MLFTFKRDDEGRERIYVGDVCVATCLHAGRHLKDAWLGASFVVGVNGWRISDAIELADEAGFWTQEAAEWNVLRRAFKDGQWKNNEVTVDVPVADNTVLSVMTDSEDFDGHLRRSTEVVSTWPAWKRGLLGGGS